MPTNIEIKARVRDWDNLRRLAEKLADGPAEIIDQLDTFFHCPHGRLKLRYFSPARGELIVYEREDVAGSKASRYLITATTEPDALREVLRRALGVMGTVRKRRYLYLVGQTRIHLDEVDGLGAFLELMKKLSVKRADLIAGAYVDMMAAQMR
jgi:adenylate cyclase class IV